MTLKREIAKYADAQNPEPPKYLGTRYNETRFLPVAGNTEVCHLDTADPAHKAVLHARARMHALPFGARLIYTPEDSLHMTVFEGVIETRRTADAWPAGFHDILAELTAASPVIPLMPPAFCRFADMTRFEPSVVLGQ